MYVLCSPCILNPSLRAKGITHPSDIALFARSIGRCKKFGIEVVPLPCPETQYLGPDREPGTFLERLNTSEFATLLDELCTKVNDIVKERGGKVDPVLRELGDILCRDLREFCIKYSPAVT
jgi:predicted secreted protein